MRRRSQWPSIYGFQPSGQPSGSGVNIHESPTVPAVYDARRIAQVFQPRRTAAVALRFYLFFIHSSASTYEECMRLVHFDYFGLPLQSFGRLLWIIAVIFGVRPDHHGAGFFYIFRNHDHHARRPILQNAFALPYEYSRPPGPWHRLRQVIAFPPILAGIANERLSRSAARRSHQFS